MPERSTRRWAVAGAFAVTLAACGSEASTPAATPARTAAATPAPASVPAGVRGSWQRTVRAADWADAGGGFPVGRWRLDVDSKGAVDVYLPKTTSVDFSTDFAVAADGLTIGGVPLCPGAKGRYTWHATATRLTLAAADDRDCALKAALFEGTWRRRA